MPELNRVVVGRRSIPLHWWAPVLLIGLVLYTFYNVYKGEFLFDDFLVILNNRAIRTLWPIWKPMFPPAQSGSAGRPLTGLSLAINYAIDGFNPRFYHAGNVAIHLLGTLTLYGVCRQIFTRLKHPAAEMISLGCAAVWSVHPLLTDSVTYCTNRSEVLMGFFFLQTIYAFLRSIDSPHRRRWLIWSAISALAAGASKETGTMAPVIVLFTDVLIVTGSWKQTLRQRWGYYLALLFTMLLLPVTLLFGSFQTVGVLAKQSLTPWQYLLMQSQVITHYLVLVYWPSQLSICYIDWPVAHSLLDVWPWMLGIGGLFLIALYGVIRRRPWGLIGAWFFLILGPTSSLLPIVEEPAGERRMYLPLIAVVALTLVGLERLLRPVQKGTVLMILLLAGIVLSLSQATLWRNEDFSTSLSIWSDTAVKRPRDYRAQNNVGAELLKAGYLTESIPFFDRALELQPALVDSYINRGTALIYLHRNDEAFRDLKEAVRITPGLSSSWKTLGWALQIDRQYTAAAQCLKQALLLDPENEDAKRFLKQPATLPAASPMK